MAYEPLDFWRTSEEQNKTTYLILSTLYLKGHIQKSLEPQKENRYSHMNCSIWGYFQVFLAFSFKYYISFPGN